MIQRGILHLRDLVRLVSLGAQTDDLHLLGCYPLGEGVQEQEMITQLLQKDERGMEALLLHCGPLMRYIIAPILPDPQDREECLSEVSMRVWSRIAQFDPARGSWNAWLTAITRAKAILFCRVIFFSSLNQAVSSPSPAVLFFLDVKNS